MRFKKYLMEDLLLEKTFTISKDVKYIYDNYFSTFIKDIDKYWNSTLKFISKYNVVMRKGQISDIEIASIKSDKLPGKETQAAHALNPCNIRLGCFYDGSFYRPGKAISKALGGVISDSRLQISVNYFAIQIWLKGQEGFIPVKQLSNFKNDLKPSSIKSTTAHEISHWLNDTFHNNHITKAILKSFENENQDLIKLGELDVNMTHFELDAQIHAIKQLKMQNKKVWDQFTLIDLFERYGSLQSISSKLYKNYGKEVLNIWQKMLVKRLAREKLLGKSMRKFIKPNELIF